MPANLKDIIQNTKDIYLTDSNLTTLLDFERVLDELDLYTFANWKMGELVLGPEYEKYFVICKFMWPYHKMPDPKGGERLLGFGCEVSYEKSKLEYPVQVKEPEDFNPGTRYPKTKEVPIWLVEITMPKKLMTDIQQGSLELEGEKIDMEELESAYEQGEDDEDTQQNQDPQQQQPMGDPMQQQQNQMGQY